MPDAHRSRSGSPQAAPREQEARALREAVPLPMTEAPRTVALIHNLGDAGGEEGAAESEVVGIADGVEEILERAGRRVMRRALSRPFSTTAATLEAIPAGTPVFNLFEGFPGDPASEVQVALLLRSLGLPATGCPPLSLHLGLHKDEAKRILRESGLRVVGGGLCRSPEEAGAFLPSAFPLFLKPAASDASHGIDAGNLVRDAGALQARLREMLVRFPGGVLVEPFLPGREFNCAAVEVSGDWVALPPSLVDYSDLDPELPPVLTFEAKWAPASEVFLKTPTLCPAPVEASVVESIRSATRRAVVALRCRGYARADFREDAEGRLHLLEVNPNPGLAADAGMAKQARAMGWSYDALVLAILEAAERGAPWNC